MSLRIALNDTRVDNIYLRAGQTFFLRSELLVVGHQVRLWSDGEGATLDGGRESPILQALSANLELVNVHFAHGRAWSEARVCGQETIHGGAGLSTCGSNVSLVNVTFFDCSLIPPNGTNPFFKPAQLTYLSEVSYIRGGGAHLVESTLVASNISFNRCRGGYWDLDAMRNLSYLVATPGVEVQGTAISLFKCTASVSQLTCTDCTVLITLPHSWASPTLGISTSWGSPNLGAPRPLGLTIGLPQPWGSPRLWQSLPPSTLGLPGLGAIPIL